MRDRLEMLLGVDESLARIVDTLRGMGALDNTVIIFTSDHGYFYGEHGLNEERRLAYEETARIRWSSDTRAWPGRAPRRPSWCRSSIWYRRCWH